MNWSDLVWIDLETTHVSPSEGRILEYGIIRTDDRLRITAERSFVAPVDPEELEGWSSWSRLEHSANGLASSCMGRDGGPTMSSAATFIRETWKEVETPVMAGSNLGFEREWLEAQASLIWSALMDKGGFVQCFDMWTVRRIFKHQEGERYLSDVKERICKPKLHRACADLRQNILELREYLNL